MKKQRTGFTLMELLVVVVLMVILLSIVLAFWPRKESRSVGDAVSQVETYFHAARARALRNNTPIGVRLLSDDGGLTFTSLQLVDRGDRWAPVDRSKLPPYPAGPMTVYLDFPSGISIQAMNQNAGPVVGNTVRQVGISLLGNVTIGDYLEIVEVTPSIHKIEAIDYTTGVITLTAAKNGTDTNGDGVIDSWDVQGIPNVNCTSSASLGCNYRYLRKPRPLLGEQPFQLPKDVVIRGVSGSMPSSLNIPLTTDGEWEIMFSPNGQVINSAMGRIVLWFDRTDGAAKPELLCVYAITGGVKAHPVGDPGNEYAFTQDGK